MGLTGKAKEDFEKWCKSQKDLSLGIQIPNTIGGVILHLGTNAEILPKRILNALIIDFFDSVGIYIDTWHYDGFCWQIDCYLLDESPKYNEALKSRQEAKTEAIKKANKIYNEIL